MCVGVFIVAKNIPNILLLYISLGTNVCIEKIEMYLMYSLVVVRRGVTRIFDGRV